MQMHMHCLVAGFSQNAVPWFLKKLDISLPYDPDILLLGICPRETQTYVHAEACTQMFMVVLFTIVNNW